MTVHYVQETLTGLPVGVDMPAGTARSRLLAAIRTGKYSPEFNYRGDQRWVTTADIAALWGAGGNKTQAALVRDLADVGDTWWLGGALLRKLRVAPDSHRPIDGPCIRDLYRALGMHTAAQMHMVAEALTLGDESKTPFAKVARSLTPAQVRTLTAAVKS